MLRLAFDIETDNLLDKVTKVHSLVLRDIDTGQVVSCASNFITHVPLEWGLEKLAKADLIIGHNIIKYDLPVLRKLYGFEYTGKIRDTLNMSRLIYSDIEKTDMEHLRTNPHYLPGKLIGRHSLKAWGYRIGELKGEFNSEETNWEHWSPEMQAYCEQDVVVTEKLFNRFEALNYSEEAIELETEFAKVIQLQEAFGFRFDKQAAVKLYSKLVKRREEIVEECRKVFPPRVTVGKKPEHYTGTTTDAFGWSGVQKFPTKGAAQKAKAKDIHPGPPKTKSEPFNPGSRNWVSEELKKLGWTPVVFTPTGKAQLDDGILEAAAVSLNCPEAKLIAEFYLVQKRAALIAEGKKAWFLFEKNGRIHGEVDTNGCVSGRCSHFKPPMAGTPKVGQPYGEECRACFIVDDGYSLVGADASGLELRNLAHFMHKYDGGAYTRTILSGSSKDKTDVHSVNQRAAGLDTRDQAKTWVYSYLYGGGDELLGVNAGGPKPEEVEEFRSKAWRPFRNQIIKRLTKKGEKFDDRRLDLFCKGNKLRTQFEAQTPALGRLKQDLDDIVTTRVAGKWRKLKKNATIRGIDGRRLHVRSSHSALNLLLQSAGALLVKKATVLLHQHLSSNGYVFGKDYANVGHFHDEFQIQVRHGLEETVGTFAVQSIREAGEHFRWRCPLDGEWKAGKNWKETH